MSYDLRRELGALAAEERSAAGALPVDELRTRAHRRRTARAIGASSLAVATVAAVAVAAVAMPGRLRTPPAETPTPTVTTPSPDATAAEWPTAVTFDGAVPGCGDAMPPLVRPDGDPEIAVATTLPTAVLVSGSSVEIAVVISTPPDAPLPAASPELLLVRDGVVVGTNRGPQDGAFTYSSVDGTLTWPAVDVDLVACGTADVGAPALEAGGYELYGVVRLQQDTQELVVVGGPFPVTLDADTTGHALADLILSTQGLGPLEFDTALEDARLLRWDESACAGTDVPGRWVADLPDGTNPLGAPSPPFRALVFEDRVTRIEVLTAGPRTIHGIGVGSTVADLRRVHPEMTLLAGADELGVVEAWGVVAGERTLAVEVTANPAGGDPYWTDDELGRVVAMVAVAGIPYAYPAWGADSCG